MTCKELVFLIFSTNISNRFSIVKYDFWCFVFREKNVCDEIDEQIIVAIFNVFDIDFDVNIEKRENFDAMTERETISIQNICFFDVAIDVAIDVTNEIKKNEISKIDFDKWMSDVNIKIDSFDVKVVAKNVNIVITVFEINENVVIDTNIAIDVIFVNSFVVIKLNNAIITNSIATNFSIFFWW